MNEKKFIDDLVEWKKSQRKYLANISFTQYLANTFIENKNTRLAPIQASVCITEQCNLNCQHCYENHSNKKMKFNDISNILYQLKENQIIELTLTGGEIFLHPQIFDIISLAKKLNFILNLQTNAILLDEFKIKELKKILNNNVDTIQVSLDGSTELIHNKQRGNGFNETIQNLMLLAQNDLKIIVNIAPSKYNEDDIYNTFKLANKLKVYGFGATPIAYLGKGNKSIEPNKFKILQQENLIIKDNNKKTKYFGGISGELLHLASNEYFINKIKNSFENNINQNYTCNGGITKCHINVDGDVFPCVFAQNKSLKLGNMLEKNFYEIWFEDYGKCEIFKSIRDLQGEKCKNCEILNKCKGGCLGIAYEKYNNINKADPRCSKM